MAKKKQRDVKRNKVYIRVPKLSKDGTKVTRRHALNILGDKFYIDQQYAFQVNSPDKEDGSVTVIRMTIPAGTKVEDGYAEIRNSLEKLGYDPYVVCKAMGFHEVINGCTP